MEKAHFIYQNGRFFATENLKGQALVASSAPIIRVDVRSASLTNDDSNFQLSKMAEGLRRFVNKEYGTSFSSFGICQPEYIDRNKVVMLIVQLTSSTSNI